MEYSNPFSAIDPSQLNGNSGGPGFPNLVASDMAIEKAQMAKPFIEIMRKEQELELQKKQLEFGEFSSAAGVDARQTKLQLDAAKHRSLMQLLPAETKRDLAKAEADFLTIGPAANQKMLEIDASIEKLKGKPIMDFMAALSDWSHAYDASGADGLTKAIHYKKFIDDYKDSHSDTRIPPNMENWTDNLGKQLKVARYMSVNSVAHAQAVDLQTQKEEADMAKVKEQGINQTNTAHVTGGYHVQGIQEAQGSKAEKNQAAMENAFTNRVRADPVIGTNGTLTSSAWRDRTPAQREERNQKIEERRKILKQEIQQEYGGGSASITDNSAWANAHPEDAARLEALRNTLRNKQNKQLNPKK